MATLMTDENLLELLKIELNKPAPYVEPVLKVKIGAAKERIEKHGIMLDMTSYDDVELVVAYAAWLYRLKNEDPDGGSLSLPRRFAGGARNEAGARAGSGA